MESPGIEKPDATDPTLRPAFLCGYCVFVLKVEIIQTQSRFGNRARYCHHCGERVNYRYVAKVPDKEIFYLGTGDPV